MDRRIMMTGLASVLAGCASSRSARPLTGDDIPAGAFSPWSEQSSYALFAGDELDIAFPSAQELNRQLAIGPDGRISLPMIGHVMAADRSVSELESVISSAYAEHLLRPAVEVTLRRVAPGKVWVDGQVRNPGVYDLPLADVDAYQAMIMAGGILPSGRSSKAALIRRAPDGQRMMVTIDLRHRNANMPMVQRGDIIYVPKTGLGELAAFFTQIRNSLPIGFSYALNGRWA